MAFLGTTDQPADGDFYLPYPLSAVMIYHWRRWAPVRGHPILDLVGLSPHGSWKQSLQHPHVTRGQVRMSEYLLPSQLLSWASRISQHTLSLSLQLWQLPLLPHDAMLCSGGATIGRANPMPNIECHRVWGETPCAILIQLFRLQALEPPVPIRLNACSKPDAV